MKKDILAPQGNHFVSNSDHRGSKHSEENLKKKFHEFDDKEINFFSNKHILSTAARIEMKSFPFHSFPKRKRPNHRSLLRILKVPQ